LYPGGKNALISWTTIPVLGFSRGVVDVTFVSTAAADVVDFEKGPLEKNYNLIL